jgi:hypothetical protein
MSTGDRIELGAAEAFAGWLFNRWKLDPAVCFVVGSVRRRRETVGDLEIVLPLRPADQDPEHASIAATMRGTGPALGLFAPAKPDDKDAIGTALRGLRPGFKACALEIERRQGGTFPVQLYRAGPEAFGWLMLMRTGPAEFGEWFLGVWKDRWKIPRGSAEHPASKDGHLVDSAGSVVPVGTEAECFRLAGLAEIGPTERQAFIERRNKARR